MNKNKDLTLIALYSALFIVTDLISNSLSILKMPSGGSISLATIVLILSSYQLGAKKSLMICAVCLALMFVTGSISYYGILSLLLDYVLSYSAYCFSSKFVNYKKIYFGIIITSVIRLVCSTISGVVIFEVSLIDSLIYQLTYLIPTLLLDMILVPLINEKLNRYYDSREK